MTQLKEYLAFLIGTLILLRLGSVIYFQYIESKEKEVKSFCEGLEIQVDVAGDNLIDRQVSSLDDFNVENRRHSDNFL